MSKRPLAGSICGLATTLIIGGLCGAPAQAQTDTTPPSVSVTSATTSSPPSGNASDAGGIQKVLLTLVKLTTDGTSSVFWTGPFTGWMASTTSLNATLSAPDANGQVTWTWPSTTGLPTYGTGRYTLKATAYDNANNTSSSSVNFFSGGDTTVPTVGFSTSMSGDNATTDHLIVPTGDASDAGGIRYVRVTLSRADETGTTYWNGLLGNASQWVSTQTFLPASVTDKAGTSGRTSVDWQIPGVTWPDNPNLTAGNQLPPGIYTWRIYANDFSENSANASLTLRITPTDSVSPTVSFAPPGPVNGSLVDGTYQTGWNGVVTGTSQDPNDNPTTPGSGVIRVTVTLTRNFTGTTEYLTSAGGWTTASTPVYADVQNPDATGAQAWTASFSGVALNGLARGSYVLKATAQDRYGNSSTASATINVTPPDSTAPTISVTTPASGANLSRLTAISGTATDNSGGSGITRAYVQLSHVFSGVKQYWTGTAWSTTATNLPVQLSSSPSVTFNWNITSGLPSGTNLPSGTSTVKAWCFDAYANQSASVTRDFNIVANTAPVGVDQTVSVRFNVPHGILLQASDAEGDDIQYAVSNPTHGTLSGTAPNLTYTPTTDYSGPDSFTFTPRDYGLTGLPKTVTIDVGSTADVAPVADNKNLTTAYNTALPVTLSATDEEGDDITYNVASQPSHGTLSGTAPNLIYTPTAGYFGADSFTYTGSDFQATGAPATVSITVVRPRLDLVLQNAGGTWVGEGIFNSDATGQAVSKETRVGRQLVYALKLEANGTPEQVNHGDLMAFSVHKPTVPDGWGLRIDYAGDGQGGWNDVGPFIRGWIAYGTSVNFNVVITPPLGAGDTSIDVLLQAVPLDIDSSDEDFEDFFWDVYEADEIPSLTDSGLLTVNAKPSAQPDITLRRLAEADGNWCAEPVVGAGLASQGAPSLLEVGTTQGLTQRYAVTVTNLGGDTHAMQLKLTAPPAGWTVAYFSGVDNEGLNGTALTPTSSDGTLLYNLGSLDSGAVATGRLEVSMNSDAPLASNYFATMQSFGLDAVSSLPSEDDSFNLKTYGCDIDKLLYSQDGENWTEVGTDPVSVDRGHSILFKATKLGSGPWPDRPVLLPKWTWNGTVFWGQQVAFTFNRPTAAGAPNSISVSCGNNKSVAVQVNDVPEDSLPQ